MSYIGDGNNVANSLMVGCAKMGMDFSIGCPDAYKPDEKVVAYAKKVAEETGSEILVTTSASEAIKMRISSIRMFGLPWGRKSRMVFA